MIIGPTPAAFSKPGATAAFWRWPPACGRGCRRRLPASAPACTATWGDRAPILLAAPQEAPKALGQELLLPLVARQIGRASCRERVWVSVDAASLNATTLKPIYRPSL